MKRIVFICFLGLLSLALFAEPPVLLRNSQYLDFAGIGVQMPNSSSLVFWNDTSSGSTNISAQKLSADGIPLWPAPRLIVDNPLEKRILAAEATSDGNIVLLYSQYDFISNSYYVYLQKISAAGITLWNPTGIMISESYWNGYDCGLVPNAVGGAFVAIRGSYPSNEVHVRNYNANGVNQWPETAIYSVPSLFGLKAISDGSGGIIINCRYWNSGVGTANHLARVNAEGDIVGSLPMLSSTAIVPGDFDVIRSSAGDYFIYRYLDNGMQLQKMDLNGNLLLPAIANIPLNAPNTYIDNLKVLPDSEGGIYYLLSGYQDSSFSKLILTRLDAFGQAVWASPINVSVTGAVANYDFAVNSNNEVWITWADADYSSVNSDVTIKSTRISPTGNVSLTTLSISTTERYKRNPIIVANADKAVIVWNDQSTERNGLACQTVTNSGDITQAAGGNVFYSVLSGSVTLHKSLSIGYRFAFVYGDNRYGWSEKIFYQITDQLISPLLEENGRALNPLSYSQERYHDCLAVSNNRFAILYSIYQDGAYNLYLQEIGNNGSLLHSGFGILVNSNLNADYSGSKLSLMGDDLLVCWNAIETGANYYNISGQRYHNAQPLWGANAKVLVPVSTSYISMVAVVGNYLVFTSDNYANSQFSLRALLLNEDGNPAASWPAAGTTVAEYESANYVYFSSAGLHGNSLVCFYTEIGYQGYRAMAQKLDIEGNRLWGDNGLTLETDEDWILFRTTDVVYGDNVSFTLLPENTSTIYLQQISPAGELLYGAEGSALDYTWNTIQDPTLIQYSNGSYSVFWKGWEDQLSRINHRYVSPGGIVSTEEPLSIAANAYGYVGIDSAHNGWGVVSFTDNNQYNIYRGDSMPISSLWAAAVHNPYVSTEDPVESPVVLNSHNYPNPFNPSTTISYKLMEANRVVVAIYNAKGQLVRNLQNEAKAAGTYTVKWDGMDNQGRAVASGVYLYKIQAGKYSNTRKMMLMK